MSVRVLIVDDQKILCEGLRSLLSGQPDMEVVGEAEDAHHALYLARETRPNVVIMDVAMAGLNAIEATRRILAELPETKVIALSVHTDKRFVTEMLRAGAHGYLLKDCGFRELNEVIRSVMQGRNYFTPRITDVIVKDYLSEIRSPNSPAFPVLTDRQYEVLQLVVGGNSTREIALQMALSTTTIYSHLRQIMQKLNIHSIAGLSKYAIQKGLIRDPLNTTEGMSRTQWRISPRYVDRSDS